MTQAVGQAIGQRPPVGRTSADSCEFRQKKCTFNHHYSSAEANEQNWAEHAAALAKASAY
eukprot:3552356-Pleurochrysis_carterae.AAC.1